MKSSSILLISYYLFVIVSLYSWTVSAVKKDSSEAFVECLSNAPNTISINNVTYTQNNASYSSILQINIQNLRFSSPSSPKPLVIITPLHEHQIQPVIKCSRLHGIEVRVRSGGHDYEGLSYTSEVPFVIIDLTNLRSIEINTATGSAWVQSGATTGEIYYAIGQKSQTLGFPAGTCSTIGAGGHFSGGAYGALLRKYGVAADNIIDARLYDANGNLRDRSSMGEELFWALRGGGGASFGVVLAWKLKLVPVPQTVTIFSVLRSTAQNATQLIHRWQSIAHKFHEDLFIRIIMVGGSRSNSGEVTIDATFQALFLGGVDRLLSLMQESFPELGVVREDCSEMSWIQSITNFAGFPIESPELLLNRTSNAKRYFKAKSDFVTEPISVEGLEGLWRLFSEEGAQGGVVIFTPYGGKMSEIPESSIPFPHRAGNIFGIQHLAYWDEEGTVASERHLSWIRGLYSYMAPYVSKSPRAAYINYKDLDLGVNDNNGDTTYEQARTWGEKYFKTNFRRLAQVKSMVDPTNFFKNELSIPLISS